MLITLTLGNVVGSLACFLFSGLSFTCFHLGVKVMKPKDNPDDLLAHMFLSVSLLVSVVFALVPFTLVLMAYIQRNPHLLDFLIFT